MKTLALKVMSIVGLVVVTPGGCTNAYGKEILNLELLCEGNAEMTFEDANAAEKYENMRKLFGDAIGFNLLPGLSSQNFSERVSIKDNTFHKTKLRVSDTKIEISEEARIKGEQNGLTVSGDLDRLTGKFGVKILFSKEILDRVTESEPILVEMGLNGISLNGDCKKLDPKKKLF